MPLLWTLICLFLLASTSNPALAVIVEDGEMARKLKTDIFEVSNVLDNREAVKNAEEKGIFLWIR